MQRVIVFHDPILSNGFQYFRDDIDYKKKFKYRYNYLNSNW